MEMRKAWGLLLAGLSLFPSGCAAPVRPFGALAMNPAGDAGRSFTTVTTASAQGADKAVREALVAAGYHQSSEAPYRVEVGFAVRPRRVDVAAAGAERSMPASAAVPAMPRGLCKRRSYVLSIAFVDAHGRVLARGGAITARCGNTAGSDILPLLARAALSDVAGDRAAS
jgi:hypothetical protein